MNSLVELYDKYKDLGLEILAFPCDQFNKKHKMKIKESDIKEIAHEKYNADFPFFYKVKVNGKDTSEIFKFLRSTTPSLVDKHEHPHYHSGDMAPKIKDLPSDFCKFLVDSNGHVVDYLPGDSEDPIKLEQRIRKFLGISHTS